MPSIAIEGAEELRETYGLTLQQMETALRRSFLRALRAARAHAVNQLSGDPRIPQRLARRRILVPRKYRDTLFFGADRAVARPPLSRPGRKRRTGRGARSVTVAGGTIPDAWIRLRGEGKSRYRNLPFQLVRDRAKVITVDIDDDVFESYEDVLQQADAIFQPVFDRELRRQVDLAVTS